MTASAAAIEDLLRPLAPQVLGALVRRHGRFDRCEDATQEALLAASVRWPDDGVPDHPLGWLLTVANRRLIDQLRSESARRRREEAVAAGEPGRAMVDTDVVADESHAHQDDSLSLLFLCCHPALSAPSQLALTLRAVGGLTTAQIAAAFLVPEATMAQRISRAKQSIRDAGARFEQPAPDDRADRLRVVLHVLYLIFNEGYAASSGTDLQAPDLADEAIRLTREVHRLAPDDAEVAGLLALMVLTDARRSARVRADGSLVPLAEQDRSTWDQALIEEGSALVAGALASSSGLGSYQVQAAIAAVHAEAHDVADTDWDQILRLYDLLGQLAPGPAVALNRVVALAEVAGPQAALAELADLAEDTRLARNHRLHAVRGHLLERSGDRAGALDAFVTAARHATSIPEKRYLEAKAAALRG